MENRKAIYDFYMSNGVPKEKLDALYAPITDNEDSSAYMDTLNYISQNMAGSKMKAIRAISDVPYLASPDFLTGAVGYTYDKGKRFVFDIAGGLGMLIKSAVPVTVATIKNAATFGFENGQNFADPRNADKVFGIDFESILRKKYESIGKPKSMWDTDIVDFTLAMASGLNDRWGFTDFFAGNIDKTIDKVTKSWLDDPFGMAGDMFAATAVAKLALVRSGVVSQAHAARYIGSLEALTKTATGAKGAVIKAANVIDNPFSYVPGAAKAAFNLPTTMGNTILDSLKATQEASAGGFVRKKSMGLVDIPLAYAGQSLVKMGNFMHDVADLTVSRISQGITDSMTARILVDTFDKYKKAVADDTKSAFKKILYDNEDAVVDFLINDFTEKKQLALTRIGGYLGELAPTFDELVRIAETDPEGLRKLVRTSDVDIEFKAKAISDADSAIEKIRRLEELTSRTAVTPDGKLFALDETAPIFDDMDKAQNTRWESEKLERQIAEREKRYSAEDALRNSKELAESNAAYMSEAERNQMSYLKAYLKRTEEAPSKAIRAAEAAKKEATKNRLAEKASVLENELRSDTYRKRKAEYEALKRKANEQKPTIKNRDVNPISEELAAFEKNREELRNAKLRLKNTKELYNELLTKHSRIPEFQEYIDYVLDPELKHNMKFLPVRQIEKGIERDFRRLYSFPDEYRSAIPDTEYRKRTKEIQRLSNEYDELKQKLEAIKDTNPDAKAELRRKQLELQTQRDSIRETTGRKFDQHIGARTMAIEEFAGKELQSAARGSTMEGLDMLHESWKQKAAGRVAKLVYPAILSGELAGQGGGMIIRGDNVSVKMVNEALGGGRKSNLDYEFTGNFYDDKTGTLIGKRGYVKLADGTYLDQKLYDAKYPGMGSSRNLNTWTVIADFMVSLAKTNKIFSHAGIAVNLIDEGFKTASEALYNAVIKQWNPRVSSGELDNISSVVASKTEFMDSIRQNKEIVYRNVDELSTTEAKALESVLDESVDIIHDKLMELEVLPPIGKDYGSTSPEMRQFLDLRNKVAGKSENFTDKHTQPLDNIEYVIKELEKDIKRADEVGDSTFNKNLQIQMLKSARTIQKYYVDNFINFYGIPDNYGSLKSFISNVDNFIAQQKELKKLYPDKKFLTSVKDIKKALDYVGKDKTMIQELRKLADMARESTIWHLDNADPLKAFLLFKKMGIAADNPVGILLGKGMFAFTSYSTMQFNSYVNHLMKGFTKVDLWGRRVGGREQFASLAYIGAVNLAAYKLYNGLGESRDAQGYKEYVIPPINIGNLSYGSQGAAIAELEAIQKKPASGYDIFKSLVNVPYKEMLDVISSNLVVGSARAATYGGFRGAVSESMSYAIPMPVALDEVTSFATGYRTKPSKEIFDTIRRYSDDKLRNPDSTKSELGLFVDMLTDSPYNKKGKRERVDSVYDIIFRKYKTQPEKTSDRF